MARKCWQSQTRLTFTRMGTIRASLTNDGKFIFAKLQPCLWRPTPTCHANVNLLLLTSSGEIDSKLLHIKNDAIRTQHVSNMLTDCVNQFDEKVLLGCFKGASIWKQFGRIDSHQRLLGTRQFCKVPHIMRNSRRWFS